MADDTAPPVSSAETPGPGPAPAPASPAPAEPGAPPPGPALSAPASPGPAPAVPPAPPAPSASTSALPPPGTFAISLREFAMRHSKEHVGQVELLGAFHHLEHQAGRHQDTHAAYADRLAQMSSRKPI